MNENEFVLSTGEVVSSYEAGRREKGIFYPTNPTTTVLGGTVYEFRYHRWWDFPGPVDEWFTVTLFNALINFLPGAEVIYGKAEGKEIIFQVKTPSSLGVSARARELHPELAVGPFTVARISAAIAKIMKRIGGTLLWSGVKIIVASLALIGAGGLVYFFARGSWKFLSIPLLLSGGYLLLKKIKPAIFII